MKKQVMFTIDPEVLEALRFIAFELRKSKSALVEQAIKKLIEDHGADGDDLAQQEREGTINV